MSNAVETPAEQARCLRCGRKIRAARSIAAKYGRGCLTAIRREARERALDGLNPQQQDKALEVVADGGVIPTAHAGVYRVAATDGTSAYLTAVTGQCNCRHGLKTLTAKPCYHVGAVRLVQVTPRRSLAKAA